MVRWQATGPTSVRLEGRSFSHDNITISRYDKDQLNKLLKGDQEYWSPLYLSLYGEADYWLKLDFEVNPDEKPWNKAVDQVRLFLEALGLFKSMLSLLTVGGLRVKKIEEGPGPSGYFGMENTIIGKPRYFLKVTEYDVFIDLLTKYRKFWHSNKTNKRLSKQLKRLNLARYFFNENFQTTNLIERHIFLSVALEALYGEGQHELKYRYSNRAALLLSDDDIKRRKTVNRDVGRAYNKRSDILHGGISWVVEPKEVLIYNEIIRQTILRCMSLYTRGYRNIGKALDECMHDPDKHAKLLKDAKALFGPLSEYKEPGESARSRGWAIRK